MKRKTILFVAILGLMLGLAVTPALAGSEDFVEFGAIGDLFTTLFIIILPIILILFVIELFLTKVLHYDGIFAKVFKI